MAKGARHARFLARKSSHTTLVLTLLVTFSFVVLVLLALGIVSLPSGASSGNTHNVQDLSSMLHASVHSGEANGIQDGKWVDLISWEPRASVYHNFLSKEECEYLIALAKPRMRKSSVVDSVTGKSVDSRVRTSSGTFLARGQDNIIRGIEERIADWAFIPVEKVLEGLISLSHVPSSSQVADVVTRPSTEHGEGLQILHYEAGQKYEPHFDYFQDDHNTKNGGQRIATVLMYLSDVEEGGETIFPNAKGNHSAVPYWDDLSECGKKGLSVKPKMGDALLFWSMQPDASLDASSLHGGCPVIRGNKWSSTKWMRVHEYKA